MRIRSNNSKLINSTEQHLNLDKLIKIFDNSLKENSEKFFIINGSSLFSRI
jgi:hypothetical protein